MALLSLERRGALGSVAALALVIVAWSLAVHTVAGFELNPTWVGVAGRNTESGSYFWRPMYPVNFDGQESVAVIVSGGPAECTEDTATLPRVGGEDEALALKCPQVPLFTGDGGLTFERARGLSAHFCGGLGALRDQKLYCAGKQVEVTAGMQKYRLDANLALDKELSKKGRGPVPRPQRDDPVVAFEEHEFRVVATADTDEQKAERRKKYAEGADDVSTANGVLMERKTGNYVTYDQSQFKSPIHSLRLGGGILHVPERKTILRNAEVSLENGTTIHAAYKSADGAHWEFVSVVPVPFSRHSQILRLSDTRVLLIAGEIGSMNQTTSLFLGNKWEKIEKSGFVMPGNNHVSRYFTTVTSGVVPRPSLGIVALGTKKNSQRSILLSKIHNDVRDQAASAESPDLLNYTDAFNSATSFDCIGPDAANDDASGCASSGFVSVAPADTNGTVLLFYDQLRGGTGWAAAARRGEHVVYAMRIRVNETEEAAEYEARVAKEQRNKEAEKENEEAAKKQREELRKKRDREKAEKKRKNRQRRKDWLAADEVHKAAARKLEKEDGQYVVIRPLDDETLDLEREMF
jgi:hypothetical protein